MASDIASYIPVTVNAPLAQPASQASASANANTDTTASTPAQNSTSSPSTSSAHNSSASTQQNASSAGGASSFSQHLAAGSTGAQRGATKMSSSGHSSAATSSHSGNSSSGSGSGNATNSSVTSLLASLIAIQLQPVNAVANAGASSGSGASFMNPDGKQPVMYVPLSQMGDLLAASSGSGSGGANQDALKGLEQLLGQIGTSIQSGASGSGGGSATPEQNGVAAIVTELQQLLSQAQNTTPASIAVSSSSAAVTNGQSGSGSAAGTSGQNVNAAISQLLTQLAGILDKAGTSTSGTATATNITNASPDASSTATLTAVIKAMSAQFASQNDTPAKGNNASAAINAPQSSSFEKILQQAGASNVSSLFAAIQDSSNLLLEGKSSDHDNAATVDPNAGNAAASTLAQTNSSSSQANASGLVKFLPAASASSAASLSDQVVVQIKNAVNTGISQIKVQLAPEDLGKVEVQLVTGADGKTGINITADSRQTLSMLQNEVRSLQAALRDIGLKTDSGGLNFNLRGQQQDTSGGNKQGAYTQVAAIGDDEDGTNYAGNYTTSTITGIYSLSVQQGLDIRV